MRCVVAREALSAWADGEEAAAKPLEVSRHLTGCHECSAFAGRLGGLRELMAALPAAGAPDPHGSQGAAPTGRRGRVFWLRLAVVVLSSLEVVWALLDLVAEHGYGGEDHAGHESVALTIAVCAGLVWIAWRPAYARAYLPLLGVAALLLGVTAAADVLAGRAQPGDELRHLGFLVAFLLLWSMTRAAPRPRSRHAGRVRRRHPRPTAVRPLRTVRSALRFVALCAAPIGVLLAAPAWGHDTLVSSTPGADALVQTLPSAVTLTFSGAVTTLPTSLQVFAPDGSRVDDGDVTHPDGDGARLSVGVSGDQQGTYLVSWRVVSADSHPIAGAFTFSVGHRSAAPTAQSSHTDSTVALLLGVARWLGYAGAALAIGGAAFLVVCWPEGWSSSRAIELIWWGLLAVVAGAAFSLLLKGPYDAATDVSSVTDLSLLREVLASTYGRAQLVRAALAGVACLVLPRPGPRPHTARVAVLGALGIALAITYAVAGHAVSDHPAWLAITVDTVHVLAMSLWFGGLVMLLDLVLRGAADGAVAGRVVRRFSAVALSAVVVLVVTGTYQGWRQVRSLAALTSTKYGTELLIKLALVAGVLLVAAGSRRWVRGNQSDLSVLRRRVSLEALGLVAVLGVTTALVTTVPARTAYRPQVNATLHLGPDQVQVSAVPSGDRTMRLRLAVYDKDQQLTEPKEVSATLGLASEKIGPVPLPLKQAGTGRREAEVAVPVTGDWTLTVDVRTSAIDEYTQTVTLPIR